MLSSIHDIVQLISEHIKASIISIRSNSAQILHENLISIAFSLSTRMSFILEKLKESLDKSIAWRSTGSDTSDIASIERLLFLMKLNIHFAENAAKLMSQMKQLSLSSSGSDSPSLKRLIRILPRVSALCEDHIEYIHQAIRKHGMQPSRFSNEDEEKMLALSPLLQGLEQLQRSRAEIASQLPLEDLLAPRNSANIQTSASAQLMNVAQSIESGVALRKSEAAASGWGLYTFYDASAEEMNSQNASDFPSKFSENNNIVHNLSPASQSPDELVSADDASAGSGTETQSDIDEAEEDMTFVDDSIDGDAFEVDYMSEYEYGDAVNEDDVYIDDSIRSGERYDEYCEDNEGNRNYFFVNEKYQT
jgi:hypothetical protein